MSDRTVLVVMHEGSYSDQSWNTYEVPAEDVESFVALSEHFGDADFYAAFPTWSDAWTIKGDWDFDTRRLINVRRGSLVGDPPESLVAREARSVLKAAGEAKFGAREYEYAKRCLQKDPTKVGYGPGNNMRERLDMERIFGIPAEAGAP